MDELNIEILDFEEPKKKEIKVKQKFKKQRRLNISAILGLITFLLVGCATYSLIYIQKDVTTVLKTVDKNQEQDESYIKQENGRNEKKRQFQVTTDHINIRRNDTVTSQILGEVKYEEIYTYESISNTEDYIWYKIKTNNGIEGYIAGSKADKTMEAIKILEKQQ